MKNLDCMIKVFWPTFISSPLLTILESLGIIQDIWWTGVFFPEKGIHPLLEDFSVWVEIPCFPSIPACMMSVKLSIPLPLVILKLVPEMALVLFRLWVLEGSFVVPARPSCSFGNGGIMIYFTALPVFRLQILGTRSSLTILLVNGYISSHYLKKLKFIPSTLGL